MAKAKEVKKRVKETAAASAKKAGKAARKAVDTVKSGAETVTEKVKAGAAVVGEKVSEMTPKVGEALQTGVESAKEGAAAVAEKVSETVPKVKEAIATGAEKIAYTVGEASQLAKLKMETHNLKSERARLHRDAGKKLWDLQKQRRLSEAQVAFAEEFKMMEALQAQIAAKEKEAEAISLVEAKEVSQS